jgi:putative PEP-CTERM system histidine kinase
MIGWPGEIASALSLASFLAGAVLSAGAGLWIAIDGDRERPDRSASIVACAAIAIWCVASIAFGSPSGAETLAVSARNLALIALIYSLFTADGRAESLKPIRPVIGALVLTQLLQLGLLTVRIPETGVPEVDALVFETAAIMNMLVAIGALVLLHNLYVGAAPSSRRLVLWSVAGLSGVFAFDLNLHTMAYLTGDYPAIALELRGAIAGMMGALLVFGASASGVGLQFRPSRAVTFQTLSLLLIGSYLMTMMVVTRALALLGGDIALATQIVFLVIAIIAAIAWLPSERLRSRFRHFTSRHLFQHRYDYREEWLRFTRTVGRGSSASASFDQRAVKALADITESPAGLLLIPNESGELELTARWNWATIEVPSPAAVHTLSALLETHDCIVDLDEVRAGTDHHGEATRVPEWLSEAEDAWALVPLIHFDRLVGAIILQRPVIERRLDWEDFDLLRVVARQLASYLAEQAGQQALMDASRFDEFNRRMAFVMHDIKNLASQLSLLSANAQRHADNPEFRADMLVTLRNSSEKLKTLLERLGRYGAGQPIAIAELDLAEIAGAIADRLKPIHPVTLVRADPVMVLADGETLEQALLHLVQNAVDASEKDEAVYLNVTQTGMIGKVEVVDSGTGMSPEFIRTGLFKPFVSSKDGGFGIGAFEAREMVRAMGGRITVESREGMGSRFAILLPVTATAKLMAPVSQSHHSKAA